MHTYQWNLTNWKTPTRSLWSALCSYKMKLLPPRSWRYLFTKEIQYLEHIISTDGIRPLPSKTQAINNMYPPKRAKEVHTFLGFIRYYRKCIKKCAKMVKPLTVLTHQKPKFKWTSIHHTGFLKLKESVTQAPILYYPDPTKWYTVYTDASDDEYGAQLSHQHDGIEFPIAFLLHTFTDTGKSGAPQNKKLMECIMHLQNRTITSKELKVSLAMTTTHWQDFSIERMPTTK